MCQFSVGGTAAQATTSQAPASCELSSMSRSQQDVGPVGHKKFWASASKKRCRGNKRQAAVTILRRFAAFLRFLSNLCRMTVLASIPVAKPYTATGGVSRRQLRLGQLCLRKPQLYWSLGLGCRLSLRRLRSQYPSNRQL